MLITYFENQLFHGAPLGKVKGLGRVIYRAGNYLHLEEYKEHE